MPKPTPPKITPEPPPEVVLSEKEQSVRNTRRRRNAAASGRSGLRIDLSYSGAPSGSGLRIGG